MHCQAEFIEPSLSPHTEILSLFSSCTAPVSSFLLQFFSVYGPCGSCHAFAQKRPAVSTMSIGNRSKHTFPSFSLRVRFFFYSFFIYLFFTLLFLCIYLLFVVYFYLLHLSIGFLPTFAFPTASRPHSAVQTVRSHLHWIFWILWNSRESVGSSRQHFVVPPALIAYFATLSLPLPVTCAGNVLELRDTPSCIAPLFSSVILLFSSSLVAL